MVGLKNVVVAVGQEQPNDIPDLLTAIGTPLSAYFTTVFYNDRQVTVTRDGNDFNAPDLRIYDHNDPNIPIYPNAIPLELRPLGGLLVQYIIVIKIYKASGLSFRERFIYPVYYPEVLYTFIYS